MGRHLPRVLLAAKSQRERRRRRAGIRLRDYSITEKTRLRYEKAVARLLPFLESHQDLSDIDAILCDYIELQWSQGESLYFISDGLSGLHFYWPEIRGHLRNAWRCFKTWRRIEAPARAPPLTVMLVRAMISRAVHLNHLSFACLLALGFHGLLRTGELLKVRNCDLEISTRCGILSLKQTKSGLRSGADEAIALRDSLTLQLLDTWRCVCRPSPGSLIWPYSGQHFRDYFRKYQRFFRVVHLNFKPYSLRRGGATFLLQQGLAMETILLRGRWKSLAVARCYLQDGLSMIPSLRIPSENLPLIQQYVSDTPITAFRL